MPQKTGTAFMVEFVQEYLSGEMNRTGFELDFNHYLIENYPKMGKENAELADCFYFYLAEQGCDKGLGLGDDEHKELIQEQWEAFTSAMSDGIF